MSKVYGVRQMLAKIKKFIARHELLTPGDRVVVAVSGGPDSMVLLHVLQRLQHEYQLKLHVAHFNHQLRGQDAEEDALFVKEFAEKHNLPVTVGTEDVLSYVEKHRLSVEDGARQLRYKFLFTLLEKWPGTKIAVGHHQDDQAETVLFHLLRGSGLAGLSGMSPKRGPIIRPLLGVSRQEIEDYCKINHLPTRTDHTNFDPIYTRNKIRLELIPLLREFNPNIVQGLNNTAEILKVENHYLTAVSEEAFKKVAQVAAHEIILDKKGFTSLHEALKRRIIRLAYSTLTEDSLHFRWVERAIEFLKRDWSGKKLGLPGGIVLKSGRHTIRFNKVFFHGPSPSFELKLPVPGQIELPAGGTLKAQEVKLEEVGSKYKQANPQEAYLDLDKVTPPLVVRSRRPGDVFWPLGVRGKKKLKDFFIDQKVPPFKRDGVPIVTDNTGQIIWVGGYRIDENFKLTQGTRRVLHLSYHDQE